MLVSSSLSRCAQIAVTQHGVISRAQALGAGLSRSSLQRLATSGLWERVYAQVYRLWRPKTQAELWHQRLAAAALWLGDGSAVSHRAAGAVWGLDGIHRAPIELSTTGRRRPEGFPILVHHVRLLSKDEITSIGLPVTSITRTLLDLAGVIHPDDLALALESALRARLVTLENMIEQTDRSSPTVAGRRVLRSLLGRRSEVVPESVLEAIVGRALQRGGLPRPVAQFEVRDRGGSVVARVDFAYPDASIAIEADGYRFHSSPRDWSRDRVRQNALIRAGWTVYRVTWEDATTRSEAMVADIAELLASHSRTGPSSFLAKSDPAGSLGNHQGQRFKS